MELYLDRKLQPSFLFQSAIATMIDLLNHCLLRSYTSKKVGKRVGKTVGKPIGKTFGKPIKKYIVDKKPKKSN